MDTIAGSVEVGEGGELILPDNVRDALGLQRGDTLVAEIVGSELHIRSLDLAVRRAQAYVRTLVPDGVSLVDELLADRRAEAERE